MRFKAESLGSKGYDDKVYSSKVQKCRVSESMVCLCFEKLLVGSTFLLRTP